MCFGLLNATADSSSSRNLWVSDHVTGYLNCRCSLLWLDGRGRKIGKLRDRSRPPAWLTSFPIGATLLGRILKQVAPFQLIRCPYGGLRS